MQEFSWSAIPSFLMRLWMENGRTRLGGCAPKGARLSVTPRSPSLGCGKKRQEDLGGKKIFIVYQTSGCQYPRAICYQVFYFILAPWWAPEHPSAKSVAGSSWSLGSKWSLLIRPPQHYACTPHTYYFQLFLSFYPCASPSFSGYHNGLTLKSPTIWTAMF